MPTLGEIFTIADRNFEAGKQSYLYPEVDNRPIQLPEKDLEKLEESYGGMVGEDAGLGVVSVSYKAVDHPGEFFILVEEGTSEEIQEVLVSSVEEIRPRIFEIPSVASL